MLLERSFHIGLTNSSLDGGAFVTVFGILNCALLCINTKNCSSFFYSSNKHSCGLSQARYNDTTGLFHQAGTNYYTMIRGFGMKCLTTADCRYQNSVCRKGSCWCLSGYSNQPSYHTCAIITPNESAFHTSDLSDFDLVASHSRTLNMSQDKKTSLNGENTMTEVPKEQPFPTQCRTEPTYVNQGAVKERKFQRPGYPVVIEYKCDRMTEEKYKYHSGSREALCDDKGQWTLPAMICIPTSCFSKITDSAGTRILYGGDVNHTKEGRECQAWKENKPHKQKHTLSGKAKCYGCWSIEDTGNKCRDMDDQNKPWCYTMDPERRWEHCDVPECATEKRCARQPFIYGVLTLKTEVIGQKVHVTYTCHAGFKHLIGGNVSTCDLNTGVWELPDLMCASEKCFYYSRLLWNAGIYNGNLSTTKTGRTCQRWDSQTPHNHSATIDLFPAVTNLSQLGNACRDTNAHHAVLRGLWCYTTDNKMRFDYCSIPECTFKF